MLLQHCQYFVRQYTFEVAQAKMVDMIAQDIEKMQALLDDAGADTLD